MKASPVLVSVVWIFLSFLSCAYSADPDPVRDFETGLSTFTLRNIFINGDVSTDTGGIRAATTPQKFPAVRYDYNISGIHFHILFASCRCSKHPESTLFVWWKSLDSAV